MRTYLFAFLLFLPALKSTCKPVDKKLIQSFNKNFIEAATQYRFFAKQLPAEKFQKTFSQQRISMNSVIPVSGAVVFIQILFCTCFSKQKTAAYIKNSCEF